MAIYTVTSLDDTGDDASVSGVLADEIADGGGLSLREAVLLANANAGADEIVFDGALAGGLIRLVQGELLVTDALTVDGSGIGLTITGDANGDDSLIRSNQSD